MKKIIKYITYIIPQSILPSGTKMVNGEKIELNITERREFLEGNLNHHIEKFRNRYSAYRRTKKLYRKHKLKNKQKDFYSIIGEITLLHAGIEQDLKDTLLYDWEAESYKIISSTKHIKDLYGKQLRIRFEKEIKARHLPEQFCTEYESLCERFYKISDERNETLKVSYAFDERTASISRIHNEHFHNHNPNISWEENINNWMPPITLGELEILREKLRKLRGDFLKTKIAVQRDKQTLFSNLCNEIEKSYPIYARQNTYVYKESLGVE